MGGNHSLAQWNHMEKVKVDSWKVTAILHLKHTQELLYETRKKIALDRGWRLCGGMWRHRRGCTTFKEVQIWYKEGRKWVSRGPFHPRCLFKARETLQG